MPKIEFFEESTEATTEKQPKRKSKNLRRAVILSAILHIAPAATSIDYTMLQRDIRSLVQNQLRKVNALIDGEVKLGFSPDDLFEKDRETMSDKEKMEWRERVKYLIIHRPEIVKRYVDEGELDLDEFLDDNRYGRPDEAYEKGFYGRFFIETEAKRGVSKEETNEAAARMKELSLAIAKEKEIAHEAERKQFLKANPDADQFLAAGLPLSFESEFRILDMAVRRYGKEADLADHFVGDLLRNGYANCSARAKLNIAIVSDLFWNNVREVKLQLMGFHIRPIIKMSDGNWYAMDGELQKLPTADLSGTAIVDKNTFIKSYIKAAPDVRLMNGNKEMDNPIDLRILIAGALLAGNNAYLSPEIAERLRSVHTLQWREKRESQEITGIEVDLTTESNAPEAGGQKRKEEEGEPEYFISEKELFDTRITGKLDLHGKNVRSLSALADKEVTNINLEGTDISDLSPLKDAPLEQINIRGTAVTEISILKGKPLKVVKLGHTGITDLSPLAGMPIEELDLSGWHIDQKTINVIKTMPLKKLNLNETDVSDISFLEGMKLEKIFLSGTRITDYSTLNNIPTLEWVTFNEDAKDLNQVKTLVDRMLKKGHPLQNGCFYVRQYKLEARRPEVCCPARILKKRHPDYSDEDIEKLNEQCGIFM